jgi:hypothetical protein
MKDWDVLLTVYLTLFISSPVIIFLHETGHALAHRLFTKPENVFIYIGTRGDKRNTWHVRIGKLNYYFKKSISLGWGSGLCVSSKVETDYRRRILILLAGVVVTFIIACIPALIVFIFHTGLLVGIACYGFWAMATLSLVVNLIPTDAKSIYNFAIEQTDLEKDGKQILFTFRIRKAYAEYAQAMQCVLDKKMR